MTCARAPDRRGSVHDGTRATQLGVPADPPRQRSFPRPGPRVRHDFRRRLTSDRRKREGELYERPNGVAMRRLTYAGVVITLLGFVALGAVTAVPGLSAAQGSPPGSSRAGGDVVRVSIVKSTLSGTLGITGSNGADDDPNRAQAPPWRLRDQGQSTDQNAVARLPEVGWRRDHGRVPFRRRDVQRHLHLPQRRCRHAAGCGCGLCIPGGLRRHRGGHGDQRCARRRPRLGR